MSDDIHAPELADYEDPDVMRRPLLTVIEAREVVDLLQRIADSTSSEASDAGRLAHLLAYRLPAG